MNENFRYLFSEQEKCRDSAKLVFHKNKKRNRNFRFLSSVQEKYQDLARWRLLHEVGLHTARVDRHVRATETGRKSFGMVNDVL